MVPSSRSIIATKPLLTCALVGVMLTWAQPSAAKPRVAVTEKTYSVDAVTAEGILQQMKARGPNGHWAYTDWYVKWTGSCQLSVAITYTMPKHRNEAKLDPALRKRWQSMVAALRKHEQKHGQHGINAAQEIEKGKCANGDALIKKWANQDKVLDKRTQHGAREGVVFP